MTRNAIRIHSAVQIQAVLWIAKPHYDVMKTKRLTNIDFTRIPRGGET